eukprot:TRINITY_DN1769_c0_g1_i2.p1 TRINITY_DN1769_c0_g1~~TRINITY_DN1769_c0_g1_i2.p1  ORF type:complete len:228 (+),score=18.76 TRINITY_DN1769_c0_g1_i2:180-863(+)
MQGEMQADRTELLPIDPYSTTVSDVRFGVIDKRATSNFCKIDPAFQKAHLSLWGYFEGVGPTLANVATFVTATEYKITESLGIVDGNEFVQVDMLSACSDKFSCSGMLYSTGDDYYRRSVAENQLSTDGSNYYLMKIAIKSDSRMSGGMYANVLQTQLKNGAGAIFNKKPYIYKYSVAECGAALMSQIQDSEDPDMKDTLRGDLESGASPASTILTWLSLIVLALNL